MATVTQKQMVRTAAEALLPNGLPDYDRIISDDGEPVDGFYTDKQMRLLTAPLYASWSGPGEDRPFLAAADVGLFFAYREPPIVPDVMLSLDVDFDPNFRSYFVWEYGKTPDAVIEIVSGTAGDELGKKKRIYQKIGIPYYIVWDRDLHLSDQALHCFILQGRKYQDNGTWFPEINLGVTVWQGKHENVEDTWLRWCDEQGVLLAMPEETIAQEKQRADDANQKAQQEKQRADDANQKAQHEKQRADILAAKLRALGIDPDQA